MPHVRYRLNSIRLHLQIGVEVAHPGVANDFGDVDARKYYTYYQWVCFVLFFQVINHLYLVTIFHCRYIPC